MTYAVQAEVLRRFGQAGLLAPAGAHRRIAARVHREGAAELAALEADLGPSAMGRLLAAMARPDPAGDCARVLGWGRAMTRIAAAPLRPRGRRLAGVLRLGARANLLVSAHDVLLDAGSPHALREGDLASSGFGPAAGGADRSALQPLVRLYAAQARRLASDADAGGAWTRMRRHVFAMHRSEEATLRTPTATELRRKSALPIVTLGLPAAWVCRRPAAERRRHVRWMWSLGDVLGWVDDVADLDEDRFGGFPNRVLAALDAGADPRALAGRLARRGAGVAAALPPPARALLAGLLRSWLVGLGAEGAGPAPQAPRSRGRSA